MSGGSSPNSRSISEVETVIRRCNLSVDDTLSPVSPKSGRLASSTMSVSIRSEGILLVMNARTT